MSAYMVDREHIVYLVKASISSQLSLYDGGSMSWDHNGERHQLRILESIDRLIEVAQMLWDENLKSINARYPDTIENSASIPGPIGEDFTINAVDFRRLHWASYKPSQVLSAIQCYEYQSCEHDEWENSEARTFTEALKGKCISVITEKEKWGVPKPMNA